MYFHQKINDRIRLTPAEGRGSPAKRGIFADNFRFRPQKVISSEKYRLINGHIFQAYFTAMPISLTASAAIQATGSERSGWTAHVIAAIAAMTVKSLEF